MNNKLDKILKIIQSSSTSQIEFDREAILAEYNAQEDNKSSIAIKILSVIGGFLATLAFLGFLLLSVLKNSEIGMIITGFVFIAISVILNRKSDKLIIDTFSISTNAVGIFLMIFGLGELGVDENIITVLVILIALTLLYLTQNYILSLVSILAISISLLTLLVFLNDSYNLIHLYNVIILVAMVYTFLFEAKIIKNSPKLSRIYNPLRIALVISFLFGLGFLRTRNLHGMTVNYTWSYSIILFAAVIYIISKIIKVINITSEIHKIGIYALSSVILVLTALSPSISGTILLILISFYVNYKFGFALGIIALIYAVSQYYYDLNYTLLTKSIMLFISGILFIVLYLFTTKTIKNEEI